MTMETWLEGVRVLDLTRYLAGPACTRLLVELGAEVIKVEDPPYGDPNRANQPRINRRAGAHIQQNRGKKSLCIDIRSDDGAAIIRSLVAHVDVVVENFSPGVLDRRGLGYAHLSEINPAIIMASISGFGQVGPLADQPCFDVIAQAYAGVMHMTGDPDGSPTFVGAGLADSNSGAHAFGAIGHALFHRERTGRGAHLDVAMVDSLFHFHDQAVHAASMDSDFEPMRNGRHFPPLAPAGVFQAPQGWIAVMVMEAQMPNLWQALGRPDLVDDPRFDSLPHRLEHRDELTELIEDWMATFPTDADVIAALTAARVPHGPTLSPRDALEHPHFVERGVVRRVHDPLAGDVVVPGFPWRTQDGPPAGELVAPAMGEHNAEVLQSLLSMSTTEIAALEAKGVLSSKPR